MMPIAKNQADEFIQDAPANIFFGRQLKAHVPIRHHKSLMNTCNYDEGATSEIPSKYGVD